MILPYTIACTPITDEAMEQMPEQLRVWQIIQHTEDVLEELGQRWEAESGPIGRRDWELGKDPGIVAMAFMYNEPASCIGFIRDTTFLNLRRTPRHPLISRGEGVADSIIRSYMYSKAGVYLGYWACGAKFWVDERHRQVHK